MKCATRKFAIFNINNEIILIKIILITNKNNNKLVVFFFSKMELTDNLTIIKGFVPQRFIDTARIYTATIYRLFLRRCFAFSTTHPVISLFSFYNRLPRRRLTLILECHVYLSVS